MKQTQYLSFDIGGTNLKYALMDKAGNIIERNKVPTPTEGLDQFINVMDDVIDNYRDQISGIGISTPGKVDYKTKTIYYGGVLSFLHEANMQKLIGDKYGLPIGIENDGKSAALAELWLGNLNGIKNGATIVLGTGVGGGIILDGKLFHGAHFQAGELSFIKDDINQKGFSGLYGGDGSAVNMISQVNKQCGNTDVKDGLMAFKAINEHNEKAMPIFKNYCRTIAYLILDLQFVLDLEKVVIGGGISVQSIVTETINEEYDRILEENPVIKDTFERIKIQKAKFNNDSNLYGALYSLLLQINNEE